MGGVPTKHHTHGKTRRRRSHLALRKERLLVCPQCKAPKLAHARCPNCGYYSPRKKAAAKFKE